MTDKEFLDHLQTFYDYIVVPHYQESWESIELKDKGRSGDVMVSYHPLNKSFPSFQWLSKEDRLKVLKVNYVKEHLENCLKGKISND